MAQLALKYRDRARERRDGGEAGQQKDDLITAQGAYRAVAPDFRGFVALKLLVLDGEGEKNIFVL
jgi:hypothetical protein